MRENKKKKHLLQRISFWVPILLLGLFVYMNLQELMPNKSNAIVKEQIMPMQMVDTIASLPWAEPEVPESVATLVYYGPILDLDRNIRLEPSGKSYIEIPFEESKEEMVDLLEVNNPRVIHLSQLDPQFKNTSRDYSKVRKSVYLAMLRMLESLPEEMGIAFYQGYRSLEDQQTLFDKVFAEIHSTEKDATKAYQETCRRIAPTINHVPAQSTGAVIEMTLFRKNEGKLELLDMGSLDRASPQSETFANRTSQEQRANRLLLFKSAAEAGMTNYGMTWWHFSLGDKMWAYVYDKPAYIFGPMSEVKSIYRSVEQYLEAKAPKPAVQLEASEDSKTKIESNAAVQTVAPVKKTEPKIVPSKEYGEVVSIETVEAFEKLLDENRKNLVLVKFYATWCGWCTKIKQSYITLSKECRDVLFMEVDVDKLSDLAKRYNVEIKPTFVFIYDGKPLLSMVGSNLDEVTKSLNLLREVLKNESEQDDMEDDSSSDEVVDSSEKPEQATSQEAPIQEEEQN
jgi:zinc D-Ala-D-Ala dipeptidase